MPSSLSLSPEPVRLTTKTNHQGQSFVVGIDSFGTSVIFFSPREGQTLVCCQAESCVGRVMAARRFDLHSANDRSKS